MNKLTNAIVSNLLKRGIASDLKDIETEIKIPQDDGKNITVTVQIGSIHLEVIHE